ncbi:TATA box-binding protein-associated factor, RNA polymerase I, subunit C [Brachyistius frenatus]|uniref:TATA box-binding protein-associated factor, RNA polymerase I, subunit C n=1 Tax=Brachyistius frenatus TaxID=100188 RepID=UPI0037E89051
MDYQFPRQLFPSFYNCGPPNSVLRHCAGDWGCYSGVRPQGGSGPLSSWTFTSKHQVRAETWRHTEPVPVPLLPPKNAFLWPLTPPDPLDFTEHMQNFFMDHSQDAFGCMSDILGENFNFRRKVKKKYRNDSVNMWRVKYFLEMLKFNICPETYQSRVLNGYSSLLSDVVHAVPPELLGSLLYEELTEQRDRLLFSEGATGGALAFVPFSQSSGSSQHGCLLYPSSIGLDRLNFHTVELQHHRGSSSCVDTSSSKPVSFQLKGPIRQISCSCLFNDCCVAVRSDHLCGVWRFGEGKEPRLLQVVDTREVATCISVSPHILGEVLVASESGAVNLWTIGRGLQEVRAEDSNLYFNAKSPWRWCEFSAHPRVMLYADRTGVELSDMRESPVSSHTLFRISSTSECRSGERLMLCRYLGDAHSFHHLITTQYSAYIMDERFPCVPMLKLDHMMQSPPVFCHVVPGSASSGSVGELNTTKVLLGSGRSQEITLLQYSGGRAEASSSRGPPQALLRPRDSLNRLPVQIPHRLHTAANRLSSPAAGLSGIQKRAASGVEECMCVLQLTEAGDIFYQILEPQQPLADTSRPPAADDQLELRRAARSQTRHSLKEATMSRRKAAEQLPAASQTVASNTSSDEDVVGPTQGLTQHGVVPETPERQEPDSDSEDSQSRRRSQNLKRPWLQVVVNDDPELDQVNGLEAGRNVAEDGGDEEEEEEEEETLLQLSNSVLDTWKRWLQKLMQKSYKKKPRPHCSQHVTMDTTNLLRLSDDNERDPSEKERVRRLREELRSRMFSRSLLLHGAVSAFIGAPDVVPVPTEVNAEHWTDPVSQRLTVSWQGEGAWRAWWEDKLGMNKEAKVQALRRKRKKEKEAKRAGSHRWELTGSFTSSVSYQSDLDDLSERGWSSAASQGEWSDTEGRRGSGRMLDVSEQETDGAPTSSTVRSETLLPSPVNTPQRVKDGQDDQEETPSWTRPISLSPTDSPASTPASRRRSSCPADDYLSSLVEPQDGPSKHDGYFLEEGGSLPPRPPPAASSSRARTPLRTQRADLSKDFWLGSPQSLPFSQSSQARLSQASQPKNKKSRMGF